MPYNLDIKNGLLFTDGGDTTVLGSSASLHHTHSGRMSSSGLLEGLTLFAEYTGLVVGITLVDPSKWSVPVLVSNFSKETVMVEPFSEVGMVAQISAIQSINHIVELHAGMILCPPIYKNCWTRHIGTWTVHNSVSWRVCCFSTRIYYFRCPVQHYRSHG